MAVLGSLGLTVRSVSVAVSNSEREYVPSTCKKRDRPPPEPQVVGNSQTQSNVYLCKSLLLGLLNTKDNFAKRKVSDRVVYRVPSSV